MASATGLCECGCGLKTNIAKRNYHYLGIKKGQPMRFVPNHHHCKSQPYSIEPYKVEDRGYDTACWIWQRAKKPNGYGVLGLKKKLKYAHRHYYEQHVGRIPEGKQLDHLCRVRDCVNPEHLEPVSCAENLRRGKRTRLTPAIATEIRNLYAQGDASQEQLGREFGISGRFVGGIVRNEYWRIEAS